MCAIFDRQRPPAWHRSHPPPQRGLRTEVSKLERLFARVALFEDYNLWFGDTPISLRIAPICVSFTPSPFTLNPHPETRKPQPPSKQLSRDYPCSRVPRPRRPPLGIELNWELRAKAHTLHPQLQTLIPGNLTKTRSNNLRASRGGGRLVDRSHITVVRWDEYLWCPIALSPNRKFQSLLPKP